MELLELDMRNYVLGLGVDVTAPFERFVVELKSFSDEIRGFVLSSQLKKVVEFIFSLRDLYRFSHSHDKSDFYNKLDNLHNSFREFVEIIDFVSFVRRFDDVKIEVIEVLHY